MKIPRNIARVGSALFRVALSITALTFVSAICSMASGSTGLVLVDVLLISVVAAGGAPGRTMMELFGVDLW